MIRVVTESYGELNQIMTGMSLDREEYTCPVIDKKIARRLTKKLSTGLDTELSSELDTELSNRLLNLQEGKNEQA